MLKTAITNENFFKKGETYETDGATAAKLIRAGIANAVIKETEEATAQPQKRRGRPKKK